MILYVGPERFDSDLLPVADTSSSEFKGIFKPIEFSKFR